MSSAAQTGMTPLLLAIGSAHFETASAFFDQGKLKCGTFGMGTDTSNYLDS